MSSYKSYLYHFFDFESEQVEKGRFKKVHVLLGLTVNFENGKLNFKNGKLNFVYGKLNFENGKLNFENGKLKYSMAN